VTTGGRARAGSQRQELVALLGLASRLPGPWAASSAAIAQAPVVVTAADAEWTIHVHVLANAIPRHLAKPGTRAKDDGRSLIVVEYAVTLTISGMKLPITRAGRGRVRAWQRSIARQLRSVGYEGRWADSGGPFAYFDSTVGGAARIPAAVTKLQRVRF
jgi:hypothetical protein